MPTELPLTATASREGFALARRRIEFSGRQPTVRPMLIRVISAARGGPCFLYFLMREIEERGAD
jgi:hypothetical protein